MIKESVTIQDVIDLLNDMFKTDPVATEKLFQTRIECNDELSNHPTIQVGKHDGVWKVSLLGVLNGIFGIDENGAGPLASMWGVFCTEHGKQDDGEKCHCGREFVLGELEGFCRFGEFDKPKSMKENSYWTGYRLKNDTK